MFSNYYHDRCAAELKVLLPSGSIIQDSLLLQTYVTYQLMNETGKEPASAYAHVKAEIGPYQWALPEAFSHLKSLNFPPEFRKLFDVPFDFFLRYAVPSLVADIPSFFRFFENYGILKIAAQAHYLICLKLTSFQIISADEKRMREKAARGAKAVEFKPSEAQKEKSLGTDRSLLLSGDLSFEDALDRLYKVYCEIETNTKICLSKEKFFSLYKAVNLYPLNNSEFKIHSFNAKNVMEIVHILSDQLGESRNRQIAFAADFYVRNLQEAELISSYGFPLFCKNRDENERRKILRKAIKLMAISSPMDVLCAISLSKKALQKSELGSTAAGDSPTIVRNDITLENGLIYSLFTSNLSPDIDREKEIIVFFPTPFFVRKWAADTALLKEKVTFVMSDPMSAELLNYYYSAGTYVTKKNDEMSFVSFAEWTKNMENGKEFRWNKAMLFAAGLSLEEQNNWFKAVKKSARKPVDIFALISSKEFEHARSPFASELDDPHMNLRSLALIPQGINNSTRPRRKLFLKAHYDSIRIFEKDDTRNKTRLYSFALNVDYKTQALAQRKLKDGAFVSINQNDLANLDQSVRQLFQQELLNRRAAGRQRNVAISYEFTPDITIWCSKSYPKNNHGFPRLEAYICEPPDPQKALRGYLERGAQISETAKRTTAFKGENICEWLENEYPYSVRHGRNYYRDERAKLAEEGDPAKKLSAKPAKPCVSIREVIIEKTAAQFAKANIALKTLWYIYPCLEDLLSGRDYKILSKMVLTELGQIYVADATEDEYISLLEELYPDDSREQIRQRCQILYTVLDFACRQGHCQFNPLQKLVTDEQHSKKMLSKIRSALTVKSLTMQEFLTVFQAVRQKLKEGKSEYLGVLIRLLTGLESNIVCALRWGDFEEITDYGIYRLAIARQVTNDGQTVRGFDSIEDYRILPCSNILAAYLLEQKKKTTAELSRYYGGSIRDFPIVVSGGEKAGWQDYSVMITPRELEQISKEILSVAGIDDHIVVVPDDRNGSKETNLAHYQGDFFRENFKYWAQNHCKYTPDELAYHVGNIPVTTFGRFYCDYLNDASQLTMFIKLQRLDALLLQTGKAVTIRKTSLGQSEFEHTFTANGSRPLCLHMGLSLQNGAGTIRLKVQNRFGVNTNITEVTEE